MQIASSAMRTCMASASAVECTATVCTPISRAARMTRSAISPRLAMRILLNIRLPRLLDDHQRSAVFHGRAILDEDPFDGARARRGDLVHCLHRFHDQQGLPLFHLVAHRYKGWCAGFGLKVDGANHGRGHG